MRRLFGKRIFPDSNCCRGARFVTSTKSDDDLLLVATDRLSAFDVVLPTPIPDKGRVLTQLSLFWFKTFATLFQTTS